MIKGIFVADHHELLSVLHQALKVLLYVISLASNNEDVPTVWWWWLVDKGVIS